MMFQEKVSFLHHFILQECKETEYQDRSIIASRTATDSMFMTGKWSQSLPEEISNNRNRTKVLPEIITVHHVSWLGVLFVWSQEQENSFLTDSCSWPDFMHRIVTWQIFHTNLSRANKQSHQIEENAMKNIKNSVGEMSNHSDSACCCCWRCITSIMTICKHSVRLDTFGWTCSNEPGWLNPLIREKIYSKSVQTTISK